MTNKNKRSIIDIQTFLREDGSTMIFRLLGEILDDQYETEWDGESLLVECSDHETICKLFQPLFGDSKVEERRALLDGAKWFCAELKMKKNQITEVSLENETGHRVTSIVGTRLLEVLADIGMDDSYLTICSEIIKKYGFQLDTENIV